MLLSAAKVSELLLRILNPYRERERERVRERR